MFYFYKVRRDGTPIPFSNFSSQKMVPDRLAVQFISQAELCCDDAATSNTNYSLETLDRKRYYVRLDSAGKPINNSLVVGSPNGDYSNFQRVYRVSCCARILPPQITSATGGNTNANIVYTTVAEADGGYNYRYSTDPTFATGVVSGTDAGTPLALTGLTNGTTYYIQFQSISTTLGTSAWSTSASFKPVVGTLTAPSLTPTSGDTTGSVSWSAVTNAVTYEIDIATNNTFTTGLVTTTSTSPKAFTGLTNGQTYYVRARAKAPTYADSPNSTTVTISPVAAPAPQVFYGNKGTGTDLNQGQIEAGTSVVYVPGLDISIPYFTSSPTFHWVAWPTVETGITNYYVNSLDFGTFGGGSPWNDIVVVGSYNFLINAYATQYPSPDPVQFKH